MDHLDGYMEKLTVAATTSENFIQNLVDTNSKQQVQTDNLIDKLKYARSTVKPVQGMMAA